MASADFLQFVVTTLFLRLQDLPGYSHVLSLFTCRIYHKRFRAAIGLCFVVETYPRLQPCMRFLFVRPEVCPLEAFPPLKSGFLQIPPRGGHPCLWLTLPAAGRIQVFHLIERALTGRTQTSRRKLLPAAACFFFVPLLLFLRAYWDLPFGGRHAVLIRKRLTYQGVSCFAPSLSLRIRNDPAVVAGCRGAARLPVQNPWRSG